MEQQNTTLQYLTFELDKDIFALEIGKVREVLDFTSVTKVPGCQEFMRGVINLRGTVVPVMDMRRKLNMPAAENNTNTCIIIVEIAIEGSTVVVGAMADAVQEVLDLEPADIEPPPRIGAKLNTDFIRGMGKRGEKFIIILDIDRVFSVSELAEFSWNDPGSVAVNQ